MAEAVDEQFRALATRTRGRQAEVVGRLIVTSIDLVAPLLLPVLEAFQAAHPSVTLRYEVSERLLELAHAEAHVAVRVGARPEQPDNVVSRLCTVRSCLVASRGYIARHGLPRLPEEADRHRFVSDGEAEASRRFAGWLREVVTSPPVTFQCTDGRVRMEAIRQGLGIGFCTTFQAEADPELVQVVPPRPAWDVQLWLLTHVDVHRTAKVQAMLQLLRAHLGDPG